VTDSDRQPRHPSAPTRFRAAALTHIEKVDYLSEKIQRLLKDFKQELTTLYGQRLAYLVLYGSFARHEATAASDVDVLVVLTGNVSPVDEIWRMGAAGTKLLLAYDELISVVPTSQDDFLNRDSALLQNIRREGILV
jgi:uncharacterized protein